jgi:hypothetical protein
MNQEDRYKHVKTRPTRVEAILVDGTRLEGYMHLTTDHRLIDQLNCHTKETPFLALTDARVLLPNSVWKHYPFFTFNRNMVVCCFPKE